MLQAREKRQSEFVPYLTPENPTKRPESEGSRISPFHCHSAVVPLRLSFKNDRCAAAGEKKKHFFLYFEVNGCFVGHIVLPASWEEDIQGRYWFGFVEVLSDGAGSVPWSERSPRTCAAPHPSQTSLFSSAARWGSSTSLPPGDAVGISTLNT